MGVKTTEVEEQKSVLDTLPEVTDQEINNFDLEPYLVQLVLKEPFYSKIIRILDKTRTDQIATAGVAVREDSFNLYYSPKFCAAIAKEKSASVLGLLKHEALHLAFEHCTSRKKEPFIIWNIATDCAINSIIPENELPSVGIWPGKAKLQHSESPTMQLIFTFPKGESADWYFSKLMESEEVQEELKNAQEGSPIFVDQDGNPVGMDDHEEWGNVPEEQKELIKGKIKQAVEKAIRECDSSGRWGSVPSEMQGQLRALHSHKVDWKKLLRNWIGSTRHAERRTTWKRINKRVPGLVSGAKRKFTASIACYVDQSGSVSDDDISLIYGELANLAGTRSIDIYPFDSSVDEDNMLTVKRGKQIEVNRTRTGGTSFTAVMNHAKKNKSKYDGIIILSDGECSDPGPSPRGLKRCWIIVPDRKLYFIPPRSDIVVHMDRSK